VHDIKLPLFTLICDKFRQIFARMEMINNVNFKFNWVSTIENAVN